MSTTKDELGKPEYFVVPQSENFDLQSYNFETTHGEYVECGDIVKRPIDRIGMTHHWGVFLGVDNNGVIRIFDIKAESKASGRAIFRYASLEEFEDGKRSDIVRCKTKDKDPLQILKRASDLYQNREIEYDVLARNKRGTNCQEVATWVATGNPQSPDAKAGKDAIYFGLVSTILTILGVVGTYVYKKDKAEKDL
jgi:hypothetical protein